MDTMFRHEILYDTLSVALDGLGLDDDDKEIVVQSLIPLAIDDESFISKFNYALTPESYQTRAVPRDVNVIGRVQSSTIPKLELPIFSFRRNSRPPVNLKARLTSDEIKFFNHYYSDEFTLNYLQCMPHDHAGAAMSRKIEYDFLLKYCWDKYCNPLLLPSNYDFSVIDVGGDWSTVLTRKQFGIHCCNPLLDERDRARDARRKARDNTDFHTSGYVCHETFQQCTKTAPVAISIHSSYDIKPEEIVATMAKRGIANYVGSMFLPENFETLEKFVDTIYGFNMFVDKHVEFYDTLIGRFNKEFGDKVKSKRRLVVFTFPNGESREYCHEYDNLLKYTYNRTYHVRCRNTDRPIQFEYKILKRVGSLIYFEFVQNFESPPVNIRLADKVEPMPYDGYRVKLESSFLTSTYIQVASPNYVYIPRGLFDTVANYCLTRITSEDFSIEHAITYVRSVMSSIQINESVLSLHNNDDSFKLMITCGLAAYQWAHERFRLLESRLPYKTFLDRYISSSDIVTSLCNKILNTDKIFAEARTVASNLLTSAASEVLLNAPQIQTKINNALRVVNEATSPCVLEIVDMHLMVNPINIVVPETRSNRRTSDISINLRNVTRILPTYPDYNQTVLNSAYKKTSTASKYIEAKTLIDEIINRRFETNDNDRDTLRPSPYEIDLDDAKDIIAENALIDTSDNIDNRFGENYVELAPIEHELHKTAMLDFIRLSQETDQQQLEQAEIVVNKAIQDEDLTVPSLKPLQADQKCSPTVISIIRGTVIAIRTLEETCHKGDKEFDMRLSQFNDLKFCAKLRIDNSIKFEIITLNKYVVTLNDNIVDQTFDAIYVPEVQLLLGSMYRALENRVKQSNKCRGSVTISKLINGVAGCGKTHMQVQNYIKNLIAGKRPAIFSATNAAAQQATDRLIASGITIANGSVSTVDSFLMHPSKWKNSFTDVYIDEALQLHCGKLIAILEILNPDTITGYGDERQITFINFSRISEPKVDTAFNWQSKELVNTTRRIPDGPRVEWLRHPLLYGELFTTLKPTKDIITVFGEATGLEKLISVEWLYKQVKLPTTAPLLVLVYRADVANDLRMRMQVTRNIPDESSSVRLAVATIGESQGEDVPNSLLLRLSSKEETLYTKDDQTIVALTRSSSTWGYITVPTNFPSLLEKVIAETGAGYKLKKIT